MTIISAERRAHLTAIGKLGGLTNAARGNITSLSRSGRRAFRDGFDTGHGCRVCPTITIDQDLPPDERARRADALYRLHFARMAAAKARA